MNFTLYLYPSVPRRHEISPPQCLVTWVNVVCALRQLIVVRFNNVLIVEVILSAVRALGNLRFSPVQLARINVLPIQDHDTVISVN